MTSVKHEKNTALPTSPVASRRQRWTKEVIQWARRTSLPALLKDRGYPLRTLPNDNYLVEDHKDLTVKEHYWTWPSRQLKGNAIDFFMFIECRTFDEAMEILTTWDPPRDA